MNRFVAQLLDIHDTPIVANYTGRIRIMQSSVWIAGKDATAPGELLKSGDAEKSKRVMAALLKMQKIDINTLRQA